MKIIIKFTNLDSTPAIKEYIEEKIGSVEKFIQRWDEKGGIEAQVELERTTSHHRKGDIYRAEVNLHLPGRSLRAEETDWDARVAVDQVKQKLQREIEKYRDQNLP